MNVEIVVTTPQELDSQDLLQWAQATQEDFHLVSETPESLLATVRVAVMARCDDESVGFAGLIIARTAGGQGITWEGREVLEAGGAYVAPQYRKHGIWRQLLRARIENAHGALVVCVTGNPTVRHGLEEAGGQRLTAPADSELLDALCLKTCGENCQFCPLDAGNAWRLT